MTRFVLLFLALQTACTVGEKPGSDATTGNRSTCAPKVTPPTAAYVHTSQPATTRAGQACMDAGCHAMGGASTQFAFAGTVYKETSAVTAAAGVTVRIFKKGNDMSLAEAVTDDAGNFIIRMPAMFTDFPYETHVTGCGSSMEIRPMAAPIAVADANCSAAGGCHGGTQGAVYLSD